ncbi:MAG: aminotransferase class V-fold PLP-dependent enzyme [Gammaproteobacteria bacterium]|nr:MAG: aminotransferase class V-fold PLP-dependent enzyme [Gammaproteobacteria bacterium]
MSLTEVELDSLLTDEFPVRNNLIYLNHAAVSPLPRRCGDAVKSFVDEYVHFGTKNYLEWSEHADQLHADLAKFINASSTDEIALLKNTSEGISVVAMGFPWESGDTVLSSNEEFPSNRIPWQALADQGVQFKEIPLRQTGKSPEQALIDAMEDTTRMLAISAVQYGSGLRLDLEMLGKACKERDIAFCVDAIQLLGALPVDVEAANIDFLMADSHKWLLGPEGIALFYCRKNWQDMIKLFQYGWHMTEKYGDFDIKTWRPAASSRRFESGTPNILGIRAFAASLSLINDIGIDRIERRILGHTELMHEIINKSSNLEAIYRDIASMKSGIVTFKHSNCPAPQLFKYLREQNIMCAERGGGVRFSPHVYNTDEEIISALKMANDFSN